MRFHRSVAVVTACVLFLQMNVVTSLALSLQFLKAPQFAPGVFQVAEDLNTQYHEVVVATRPVPQSKEGEESGDQDSCTTATSVPCERDSGRRFAAVATSSINESREFLEIL